MLRNSYRGVFAIAPWLFLMGVLALASSSLSSAFGQEEEEPAAEKPAAKATDAGDAAEPEAESQSMLMWLIETAGLIGAIILVISIFFVHRVVTLFLEFRPEIVAPPDLLEQIEGLLAKRDYNDAQLTELLLQDSTTDEQRASVRRGVALGGLQHRR